jgi:hypothetical protein
MRIKRSVYGFLLAFIITLVVVNGCLIKKTADYKWENRELILQNDSLRGVVIELTRKIDTGKTASMPSPSLPNNKN